MSGVKPFNTSNWLKKIDYDNNIDYFFTQRKIVESIEYVDESTLERKTKKESVMHNFLAINLPLIKEDFNHIKIEVWGDKSFNYEGEIVNYKGISPSIMLKLNDDTKIFIKLIYFNDTNHLKTYINFIEVLKRYQKS